MHWVLVHGSYHYCRCGLSGTSYILLVTEIICRFCGPPSRAWKAITAPSLTLYYTGVKWQLPGAPGCLTSSSVTSLRQCWLPLYREEKFTLQNWHPQRNPDNEMEKKSNFSIMNTESFVLKSFHAVFRETGSILAVPHIPDTKKRSIQMSVLEADCRPAHSTHKMQNDQRGLSALQCDRNIKAPGPLSCCVQVVCC